MQMRRTIITAVALTVLAVPGAAIASHQGHSRHESVHHKRHHRQAHILRFGAVTSSAPSSAPVSATSSPSPVTTTVATGETAGTIASFTNGTLTITLNDGSSVSGKVTPATEIECRSATASAADHGDNGDNDGIGERGGPGSGDSQSGDGAGHDEGDRDAGDDDAHDEAEHCSSTALVPGASVREAVLSVGGAGAFWVKLEL